MRRFVIEGIWSGYKASQRRVVHRQVYPPFRGSLRAWASNVGKIAYTDGTHLEINVRDVRLGEKVSELRGYSELIEDCAQYRVNSVEALQKAKFESQFPE